MQMETVLTICIISRLDETDMLYIVDKYEILKTILTHPNLFSANKKQFSCHFLRIIDNDGDNDIYVPLEDSFEFLPLC